MKILTSAFVFCLLAAQSSEFLRGQTAIRASQLAPAVQVSRSANTISISSELSTVSISPDLVEVGDAAAASASTDPKVDQTETLLFTEMQKLKFDRRPSMILRTWAELEASANESQEVAATQPAPQAETVEQTATESVDQPKFDKPPRPLNATEIAAREAAELAKLTKEAEELAKKFQQQVTIGKWDEAAKILRTLKVENQVTIYQLMLQQFIQIQQEYQKLANVEGLEEGQINNQQFFEKNRFTLEDLSGLLAMAPRKLKRSDLATLGQIGSMILESGISSDALEKRVESLVAATPNADIIEKEKSTSESATTETPNTDTSSNPKSNKTPKETNREAAPWLTRRNAAWLLLYCQQLEAAERFLPTAKICEETGDAEGLNMIARLTMAKSLEDDPDKLLNAWNVLQIVIKSADVPNSERNEALLRSVALVPSLDKEIGVQWLKELFSQNEAKTKEILAVMGERVSRGLQSQAHNADARGDALKMMKVAAETLYEVRPEWAAKWNDLFDLMATSWLREARFSQDNDTSTSLGPQLQRDRYGNFFYYDYEYMYNRQAYRSNQMPTAVTIENVLDTIPAGKWFENIDEALRPEISMVCANMLLKVNEDEKAFPYIEALASTHKDKAQQLAEQFLRVWTENHDMNSSRGNNRYSPYYYSYGFNQSAESIPLTRSKQERNLKDLTKWVAALRQLPGVEVDQELLANAFTTCHSGAEVYRFEEIETVFGPMQDIDPDVLAALCERMRSNLAGQWLVPDVQKQNNTKRTKNDILEQVLRGYALAMSTVNQAIAKHPDNWRLHLQKACLLFDDNEYRSVLTNRNEYTQQKNDSFEVFAKAAKSYHEFAKTAKPNEYSADVYEKWFYAMLGATDLAKVAAESSANTKQTELISEAIQSLGDKLAEEHLRLFANVVVTRVGMANPGVKFSFLTEGFKITGDRREVTQAKRLHEYYRDLVTELHLEAMIDGNDTIAPDQPFGVYVRINHTPEIERESGGFGRFLQNQNSMGYAYNYGRPTANYRDKFEEAARTALAEHFEVISVTFERESINSRPLEGVPGKEGWHTTPYAYLLLQARGTEVDRLPSLKMDLDFLDTTGYIVLPIMTSEIPLACDAVAKEARPFRDLKVTQTLDQREGKDGKLTLEVKASCMGLVPELERILKLNPDEFEIVEMQDSKPMITAFDKDSKDPIVVSERTWDIKLKGRQDLTTKPDEFQFGDKVDGMEFAEWSTMGFNDEDIIEMEPIVKLNGNYGEAATPWMTIITIGSAGLLGVIALSLMFLTMGGEGKTVSNENRLENLTPFALVTALSSRLESGQLSKQQEAELREEIHRLEQSYFAVKNETQATDEEKNPGQLTSIAERWL